MRLMSEKTGAKLHNLFEFTDKAFGDGNEMLVLVTELTAGKRSSEYLSMFNSPDYEKYNERLMLSERQNNLRKEIENVVFNTSI